MSAPRTYEAYRTRPPLPATLRTIKRPGDRELYRTDRPARVVAGDSA